MKTIKNALSTCNTLALLLLFPILGNSQVISKAPEDLIVIGNESINFQSDITNSEYKLYINLPESYDIASKKTYPVYYALDGNRTFDVTTRIYNGIWDDGFVPEMIIVGITYSGSKTNPNLNRSRDLTPTNIDRIASSGGASNFLKVLADEIIPFIDSHYRSDRVNRTLAGTSFAGLFAHYTLFTKPTLFKSYIINNPTFWWDNDYSYKLEDEFYKNNQTLNAKVIFLTGEFDAVEKVEQMVEQIEGHNYDNLTLDFRMVENMGHLGGEAEAINQGMSFVYRRPTINIPENELKEYCGTYKDGNYIREIVITDGELSLKRKQASSGANIKAITKNVFAIHGRYFDFRFNRNKKGEVISFSSQLDADPSRVMTAIKID